MEEARDSTEGSQPVTLTLPRQQRPEWIAREGIVMAGSWEPLPFRVRRANGCYTPTPEQQTAYAQEHSPDTVARLKALGVNVVMMHGYKGCGLDIERESMADSVRFADLCHSAGLHVGVYAFSGAFVWDSFFKEIPDARDWILLNEDGSPKVYGKQPYRYYWNRNHPDAVRFYQQIVRFMVETIGADLVHFDNYGFGPGHDAYSAGCFRRYLAQAFTPAQLRAMQIHDLATVQPPRSGGGFTSRQGPYQENLEIDAVTTDPGDNQLLWRAWLEFCCRSLSDSYHEMGRYARTLRQDILVECNPSGVRDWIVAPRDHGRLLQGGEAFWDESRRTGFQDGILQTGIRTYKIARRMDNIVFSYVVTPLDMAESMAFNLDCLGCIGWFEGATIRNRPGGQPLDPDTAPFIRFFRE